jgi:hypothetical protein
MESVGGTRAPSRSVGWILPGLVLASAGCGRVSAGTDSLTIATTWQAAMCAEVEADFGRWLVLRGPKGIRPLRIHWVAIGAGDELSGMIRTLASHMRGLDGVLGGPAAEYARVLAGSSTPGGTKAPPAWHVLRRMPIGLAVHPSAVDHDITLTLFNKVARAPDDGMSALGPGPAPFAAGVRRAAPAIESAERGTSRTRLGVTFDDPRRDAIALGWAQGELARSGWGAGYARLVGAAGCTRRIGRRPGAALAAVERGEADATPATPDALAARAETVSFVSEAGAAQSVEGVAIVANPAGNTVSGLFLQFLTERGQASPPPATAREDAEAESLLAELLGATLVDAQDELVAAWAALERAGHPARAEMWITQAPPWPPASIQKLNQLDPTGGLQQTLAGEIAPEADVRAWLLRSWLSPDRLVDGALLAELARAVDGRLVREPRFRAWLRAEWTAWARQRYRRVARKAAESAP